MTLNRIAKSVILPNVVPKINAALFIVSDLIAPLEVCYTMIIHEL